MAHTQFLRSDQILSYLSVYKNAIALYTTEDIVLQYANDAMLAFWDRDESILGLPLDVALPEIKEQPFMDMLRTVYRTGVDDIGEAIQADLLVDGELKTFYFDYAYRAIKNEQGETVCIMHTAEDVTDQVINRQALLKAQENEFALEREQALNEELAAANEELSSTNEELNKTQRALNQLNVELEERVSARTKDLEDSVSQTRNIIENSPFPIGVYLGRELRIAFANSSIIEVWGKGSDVIGKLYTEVLPELQNQEVFRQLDDVFVTGKPFHARNQRIDLVVDGVERTFYFNYSFNALTDDDGRIYGVMNTAADVTDAILAKQEVEKASGELALTNQELATVNEEQQAMNEEMAAINEELTTTNEELVVTQDALKKINNFLAESENRFRRLVQSAPVAIFVLRGPDMVFEMVNDLMYRMLGKTSDIIGKSYAEAVPELVGQPFFDLLNRVYVTGETFYGNEIKGTLDIDGQPTDGYFNFIYQAIKDEHGEVTGIMCVAIDVIEQVKSRQLVERAEESLRIATESGELATWYYETTTGKFEISARFKQVFGIPLTSQPTYEEALLRIRPDYLSIVSDAVNSSLHTGKSFNIEYPVIGEDDKERWVRSVGKMVNNEQGITYITGVLADITEQKQDEIRKNDFIGMVSHELKTPLTSLSAYLQVLQSKAKKSDDTFSSSALDQSVKQVKKMTIMINGFLNVSRLESGKINIDRQIFDMADLVKETKAETLAMNSSHNFIFHPVEKTLISADKDKIGQVISNFISNAVKYSKSGSTIQVSCITLENQACFSVRDEGIGIRAEDITRLFERYYRVESVGNVSGFGIGLYLSAEIIQRHGGKIWVESEPGKGSIFYFSLPLNT